MKQYYINALDRNLVMYDTDRQELIMMEPITKIRIGGGGLI